MAATESLQIDVSEERGVLVVSIKGPVDSITLDEFKGALDDVFKNAGAKVLLDCSHLKYINSRATGMLMKYRRHVYAKGGRLALCGLDKKIGRMLDLLGLNKILRRYDSKDEAIQALL